MAVVLPKKATGKQKRKKLTSLDVELAVASYLNVRTNLIVPNVFWSLFNHECDLLVITKAGYAWEIEIKVTKADLVKDKEKWHGHYDKMIKDLYFALPDYLEPHIEHVPERAGIILVDQDMRCRTVRRPRADKAKYKWKPHKFTENEKFQVARLGALRLWGLKRKVRDAKREAA